MGIIKTYVRAKRSNHSVIFGSIQPVFIRYLHAANASSVKVIIGEILMEIPYQQLSADALRALIEEYVSRDGTDYGEQEVSLERKVIQVEDLLRKGTVAIVFDTHTESCDIVARE